MALPVDAPATLLAVDDEPNNLEILTHFLELDGHRVLTAPDGEAALSLVSRERPDLVLLDVMLPGLDGFAVCRTLKAAPETFFVPVIILTALKSTDDRVKGAAAGADEFLSKPFDHVELRTRVRSLLRLKRAHDQIQAYTAELEAKVAERTAELRRALADLQALDQIKSDFIANVSHELRTPLLHVKGYVGLVADGMLGGLTSDQSRGLSIAKNAVARLEQVVDDVVDFSNVSQRRIALEPVPPADVCRHVTQGLAAAAVRRAVTVNVTAAPGLPAVLADRVALTRTLRHLLDNAIKFGPEGGVVDLRAERRGPNVRFSVLDLGPGISPTEQARIFDLFYQTDASDTRPAGGLGLGLPLVRLLLEAHGAKIQLESELGKGSTFWFELPVAQVSV